MISVAEARARVLGLAQVTDTETVALRAAHGRVLDGHITATRTQPPFAASAMDGYAVQNPDIKLGAWVDVIGQAAAGHGFDGQVNPGQAVRIFTGAPVPQGADHVVIQENVTRMENRIRFDAIGDTATHIRPLGGDFHQGDRFAPTRRLTAGDVMLIAAMNHAKVTVRRKPVVAIIATGDELVMPGQPPGADQIIASNSFGVAALLDSAGAETRVLPIARDTIDSLKTVFDYTSGADLIVTIGGASVGDHDLVGPVAESLGLERAFYKIAMRPGKPLMAGRLGPAALIGLPGNPVSALVCTRIFLIPFVSKMLGLPDSEDRTVRRPLAVSLAENGPRAHYMRAALRADGSVAVAQNQDSSLLSVLTKSDTLVVRPPHDPSRNSGEDVACLPLWSMGL